MRALARDLARACGTVGHITVLRRLRVGPFTESMAVPMDTILNPEHTPPALAEFLLPIETALDDIPALALTAVEAHALSNGQAISLVDLMGRIPDAANPDNGLVRVLAAGRVLALGRLNDGWLKSERLIQHFS
jgi:tRNA pseudouridine55 synthase